MDTNPGKPVPVTVAIVPETPLTGETETVAPGTLWVTVLLRAVPDEPVPEALTSLLDGMRAVVGTVNVPDTLPLPVAVTVATVKVEVVLTL
jgi:hypothetical protein